MENKLNDIGVEVRAPKIEIVGYNPIEILKTWVRSRSIFLEFHEDSHEIVNIQTGQKWDSDSYLKQLIDMDISMCYFSTVTINLSTSILIRDFLYTFMYKGKWATTNRYRTVKNPICSKEALCLKNNVECYKKFIEATKKFNEGIEVNFDKYRECMPLSHYTEYSMHLSIKEFIQFISLLYYTIKDTMPEMWQELYIALRKCPELDAWLPKIRKYINISSLFSHYKILDNKDLLYVNEPGDTLLLEKSVFTCSEVGAVLYSQLIRHEDVEVVGYCNFLRKIRNKDNISCSAKFPIMFSMNSSKLEEIIKVRTSPFAVFDYGLNEKGEVDLENKNSWSSFIDHFIEESDPKLDDYKKYFKYFDKNGNFIESSINKYKLDDSLRVHKGYNAYVPDYFSLEWKDLIYVRAKRFGWSKILKLHLQMFENGYIKDNPKNPLRLKFIELNPGWVERYIK